MARSAAVPLAPGVWRIPTVGRALVNSYAFVDDDGAVTLVDCGVKRAPAQIVRGLAAIGKAPADVTRIVLTHAHRDHAGGAAEMARRTGAAVAAHRADDTVTKAVHRILRAELVIIDDIGLLPVADDAAEGLYRIVDAAYEKRSVAISSNLHPAGFDELMPKTLATATVDRLLHHAHVCQTTGDSVRMTQAMAGKGVMPLN